MKNLINVGDTFKILMIYLITTIATMIVAGFAVKYDYIKIYLKNYLWVMVFFTILFLILIKLFKVNFKAVLVFLGVIIFLLIFVLLNLDIFISIASTPNKGVDLEKDASIKPLEMRGIYYVAEVSKTEATGKIEIILTINGKDFSNEFDLESIKSTYPSVENSAESELEDEDIKPDTQENTQQYATEDEYYMIIKEAWQRQVDYINLIPPKSMNMLVKILSLQNKLEYTNLISLANQAKEEKNMQFILVYNKLRGYRQRDLNTIYSSVIFY